MKKVLLIVTGILWLQISMSQTLTVGDYIELHKDFAIREMKRMGVPAAITLAQGILETDFGNSPLVKKSNNHFGIKCKNTWTAAGVSHDDDAPGECFRTYKDAECSYRDHSNFLRGNVRYAFLFKLDPGDYKAWSYGLKKAGYATNPNYPKMLIKNIEDNDLQQYSLLAINDVPVFDASKYTDDPEDKVFNELVKAEENEEKVIRLPPQKPRGNLQFEDKIMINGSQAILAKKGASLLAIAVNNNINLARLLEYNELDKDGLLNNDQVVFLEKKSKEGETDTYVLQEHETLYDAAQKNGVRLQSLYEYNEHLKSATAIGGEVIHLRPHSAYDANSNVARNLILTNAKDTNSFTVKLHSVQPKEGLYSISKKYGITIMQIKEWNNLPGDILKVGQQLIISASN